MASASISIIWFLLCATFNTMASRKTSSPAFFGGLVVREQYDLKLCKRTDFINFFGQHLLAPLGA